MKFLIITTLLNTFLLGGCLNKKNDNISDVEKNDLFKNKLIGSIKYIEDISFRAEERDGKIIKLKKVKKKSY